MCGFAVFLELNRIFPDELLDSVDLDLFHRGPDGGGRYNAPGVAAVFRRLSIIDPHPRSDQPLWDRSDRYMLLFNGEIYNYKLLRQELLDRGVPLQTQGDSEVIVEGFAEWGDQIFEKLEGMFAIVVYDKQKQIAWAARDPLGIKPLYILKTDKGLGLASEMRPLRRLLGRTDVDIDALSELLMFRFAAGRLSNLKSIELLPGGVQTRYSVGNGSYAERTYCDVSDTICPDSSISLTNALSIAENAITHSIEAHLQSDVGYSIQLSGGVDSSLVLALSTVKSGKSLDSFGVRLPDPDIDESYYRSLVIDRYDSEHLEVDLDSKDFAEALPRSVYYMEGPTPHFGCVMLMLLCKQIKKKHKVVLTGEGADEFFGGYERYAKWKDLRLYGYLAKLVPESMWPLLKRYSYLQRFSRFDAAIVSSVYFDFIRLHEIFPGLIPKSGSRGETAKRFNDFRDRLFAVDQTSYLSSLLMRQDKMSMAESVEARVPFAHYPLAKSVNQLPRDYRVQNGETKPLLKAIARKWLPREVVDRRKVGLTLPLGNWLRDDNGLGRYLTLLTQSDCHLATYAEQGVLKRLADEFRKSDNVQKGMPLLAHLINIELWLRSLREI